MTLEQINEKKEVLLEELYKIRAQSSSLWESFRAYPSNNELRRKSNGNKGKFERLKSERDAQIEPILNGIEECKKRDEEIIKTISGLEALPCYVDFVWETEGKPSLMKKLNNEMIEHLKEEGYNTDFFIERAKESSLAREILVCYETPNYGRGYVGYSMSANAWEAQDNRQKPMSKWNKKDLEDFNSLFGTKTTLKKLKAFLEYFGSAGTHHTSKFYNETEHYSIPLALLNSSRSEFEAYFGKIGEELLQCGSVIS